MTVPQTDVIEILTCTISDFSASGIQAYGEDPPRLICEVLLDGNSIFETSEANCPVAPHWDCSVSFSARPNSLISLYIIDTTAKRIASNGRLVKGMRLGRASILARDFYDLGKRACVQLDLHGRKNVGILSVALALKREYVTRPIPIPQLSIPAGKKWDEYFVEGKNLAWKQLWEWLSYRGYDLCFAWMPPNGAASPLRPRISTFGANEPFLPRPGEEFAFQTGKFGDYPHSWLADVNPIVRHAYDESDRLVILKLVGDSDTANEIDIMRYLNSPELRLDHDNHCLPVLDVLETALGFSVLVLPCWDDGSNSKRVLGWQVDDYFETAIQAFEGLAFMHERRIFHRDISPNNLTTNHLGDWETLTPIPFPSITTYNYALAFFDFEMSVRFPAETPMRECRSDKYMGTVDIMAPEVSLCGGNPAPESYELGPADVHALAATLLDKIHHENDEFIVRLKDRRREYPGVYAWRVLTELVPVFIRLLEEATNAEPSARPGSSEMVLRLRALREAVPVELRFAPPEGYRDYPSLMVRAIQAHLI